MTTPDLRLPAPAKLNLFLHIIGQRPDGYHLLETLFQFLDHSDELLFWRTHDGQITLSPNLPGVAPEDNLIVQAARALQPFCSDPMLGVRIELKKCLPIGGGLGGGSSNAATVLLALNLLWQLQLDSATLAQIGLSLGADVPIFLYGQAAFARGIGEKLIPQTPVEAWYLVLQPDVSISTATIFTHPDLPRQTPSLSAASTQRGESTPLDTSLNWQTYQNDCQSLVESLYPQVALTRNWLLEYAPSRMTGTGACIFAVFPTREAAEYVLAKRPKNVQGFVAQGKNTSPTHLALAPYVAY